MVELFGRSFWSQLWRLRGFLVPGAALAFILVFPIPCWFWDDCDEMMSTPLGDKTCSRRVYTSVMSVVGAALLGLATTILLVCLEAPTSRKKDDDVPYWFEPEYTFMCSDVPPAQTFYDIDPESLLHNEIAPPKPCYDIDSEWLPHPHYEIPPPMPCYDTDSEWLPRPHYEIPPPMLPHYAVQQRQLCACCYDIHQEWMLEP